MNHFVRKTISLVWVSILLAGCTSQTVSPLQTNRQMPTPANVETVLENGTKQVGFTSETKAQEYALSGATVYFFKANWCPTCNIAQKDLDVNLSKLPKGTTIVVVDYDKETALKQKYAVTYQHTFVQIDKDGAEVSKWNGGGVEEISEHIKTV